MKARDVQSRLSADEEQSGGCRAGSVGMRRRAGTNQSSRKSMTKPGQVPPKKSAFDSLINTNFTSGKASVAEKTP